MKQLYIESKREIGIELMADLYVRALECNLRIGWLNESPQRVLIAVNDDSPYASLDAFLKKVEQFDGLTHTNPEPYRALEPNWRIYRDAVRAHLAEKGAKISF